MRRPALLAFAAGLLLTLGLPPFGWWPLALLGAGVLTVAVQGRALRPRALVGLAAGAGFLGPGLFWMTEFSLPGWVLAMFLEAAIFTLAVSVIPPGRWQSLGLPAAFVLADSFRGVWPFGGVPIATLGQTQIGGPLLGAARVGGSLLLAALVGVAGVTLAALWDRRWILAALGATLVVAVSIAGAVAPDGHRAGSLRAALVQGGGQRGTRAINSNKDAVFRAHLAASERIAPRTDLILWPEDVVDVDTEDVLGTPTGDALAQLALDHHATLVAGVITGRGAFHNLAIAWGPDGAPGDRYEKNYRVPFGEFIPFRALVDKVADLGAVPHDAHVGRGPGILRTKAGDLGVVISYEVFFARRARDAMASGAEVLLVPTNASSYSSTQMPALELGAARLRAVETGRDVLQAAPTGFSAVIDHRGHVEQHSDLGRRTVLGATVQRRTGDTIYTRLGDGPFVTAALLALALAWRRTRRSRDA